VSQQKPFSYGILGFGILNREPENSCIRESKGFLTLWLFDDWE
jgi:hypothetical protein